MSALRDHWSFVAQFLKSPRVTGAVAPSSKFLAQRMLDWIDWGEVKTVVEYGPGCGAFTGQIVQRMRPDAEYLAVEIDDRMITRFQERFPRLRIVRESVANIGAICEAHGIEQIDVVICGLPWASFDKGQQDEYLEAMVKMLGTRGAFATFAYLVGLLLPAGHRFKSKLSEHFGHVTRSSVAWLNVPPAFVYRCRRHPDDSEGQAQT